MSIWKRGTNLVKGMISEASKSDDPTKMQALEKEMAEETKQKPKVSGHTSVQETLQKASQVQEIDEISEENPEGDPEEDSQPQNPDKSLTPKKRTI